MDIFEKGEDKKCIACIKCNKYKNLKSLRYIFSIKH